MPFQVSLLASNPKQYVTDIKLQELAQVIATTFVYLIGWEQEKALVDNTSQQGLFAYLASAK